MFTSIEHFKKAWEYQTGATNKIMAALTDASLKQEVAEGHRALGRLAWHLAISIPEMAGHTGLTIAGPKADAPVPETATEIANGYKESSTSLVEQITANWNDETLKVTDNMYGETWARGLTLSILINHEIHHRGQMTVLMRQAGLKVPGIFGPAKEEWEKYGMKDPEA